MPTYGRITCPSCEDSNRFKIRRKIAITMYVSSSAYINWMEERNEYDNGSLINISQDSDGYDKNEHRQIMSGKVPGTLSFDGISWSDQPGEISIYQGGNEIEEWSCLECGAKFDAEVNRGDVFSYTCAPDLDNLDTEEYYGEDPTWE